MPSVVQEGYDNVNSATITGTPTTGNTIVLCAAHRTSSFGADPAATFDGNPMVFLGQREAQIGDSTFRRAAAVWTYEVTGSETGRVVSASDWTSGDIYWAEVAGLDGHTLKGPYFNDSGAHSSNPTDATADVTTAALAANAFRLAYAAWKKASDNPSDDASIAWDNLTDAAGSGVNTATFAIHQSAGHFEDASSGAKTDTATLTASNTESNGWVTLVIAWEPEGASGATVDPSNLAQEQALGSPALTQAHVIQPVSLAQVQSFEAPAVTQDHQLSPQPIAQSQVLEAVSLTQDHQIAPADMSQAQALVAVGLTQDHQLSPVAFEQLQALTAPTIEQVHTLAAMDMAQVQSLEAASLIIVGLLSPQDMAQVQELGAVVLTQDHQLVAVDLAQLQALEAATVTHTHALSVGDIEQLQALEEATLVLTGTVVPVTAVQQQALDSGQITQTHLLAPENITQLQVFGGSAVGQGGYLVVSSIRVLPALEGDVSVVPALEADVSVVPALTGTVSVKPH